jgi:hypothetical protein
MTSVKLGSTPSLRRAPVKRDFFVGRNGGQYAGKNLTFIRVVWRFNVGTPGSERTRRQAGTQMRVLVDPHRRRWLTTALEK